MRIDCRSFSFTHKVDTVIVEQLNNYNDDVHTYININTNTSTNINFDKSIDSVDTGFVSNFRKICQQSL